METVTEPLENKPPFSPIFERELVIDGKRIIFHFDPGAVKADIIRRTGERSVSKPYQEALKKITIGLHASDLHSAEALDEKFARRLFETVTKPLESMFKPNISHPGGLSILGLAECRGNNGEVRSLKLSIDIDKIFALARTFLGPKATSDQICSLISFMTEITYNHEAEHIANYSDPKVTGDQKVKSDLLHKIYLPNFIGRAGLFIIATAPILGRIGTEHTRANVLLGLMLAASGYTLSALKMPVSQEDSLEEARATQAQINTHSKNFDKIMQIREIS